MSKIFGREPAIVLAFFASLVMMVSTFVLPLSTEQQGALNAVAMAVVGIATMWAVAEDGGLGLVTGFCQALLALAISFGLAWDPDTQATVMSFLTIGFQAFLIRPNVVAPITASGDKAKGKTLE